MSLPTNLKSLQLLTADELKAVETLFGRVEQPIYEHGVNLTTLALNTAECVYNIGMEKSSVLLALTESFVRHDIVTVEEISQLFGEETAQLAQMVKTANTKPITLDNLTDDQFADFVISFVKDIRIIIHLIAYVYSLMKEIDKVEDNPYGKGIAAVCRLFYSPIAHRLGLYEIKREFEDFTVKYEHPEEYKAIIQGLQKTREERDSYLRKLTEQLREKLDDLEIPYELKWRTKSIHSIYVKMQAKGCDIDGIYDIYALRVILDVPEKLEKAFCWAVFGQASSLFVPNMLRTKDWVGKPKASGYESLHTTVLAPGNHWVEIQVRSKRMDEVAEHGQAAHWIYKGVKGGDESVNRAILSIRTAIETRSGVDSLIQSFSDQLCKGEMFIFDNADRLHKVPADSRIVDYIIHIAPEADWVELFCGAKVNGEFQDLEYPLSNGDRVELVVAM